MHRCCITMRSMDQDAIKAIFDQQAAGYDAQWARTAPINRCLYVLLESLSPAQSDARATG